jgi:hypothetical protein
MRHRECNPSQFRTPLIRAQIVRIARWSWTITSTMRVSRRSMLSAHS